ncbi:hypothetical protein PENTCL1PPCAC_3385, partial [Pristionchus entomophagus]
ISSIITRSPQFIHNPIDLRHLLLVEVEHAPVDSVDVLLEYLDRVAVHHLLGHGFDVLVVCCLHSCRAETST